MVQVNTFWSGILLTGTFSYLAWISVTPQPPNSSSAPTYTISNLMLPCPIGLVLMPCVWTNSILPYHVTQYFFKVLEINFLTQKCMIACGSRQWGKLHIHSPVCGCGGMHQGQHLMVSHCLLSEFIIWCYLFPSRLWNKSIAIILLAQYVPLSLSHEHYNF